MSVQQQRIKARSINPGFEWRLRIVVSGALTFEADARYAAQVRPQINQPALATMTTENGGIRRINSRTLELFLTADATADMAPGAVLVDVVRVFPTPVQNLGFRLTVPVKLSVTREFT